MSDETTKKELQSVDTNTIPWGELYIEQLKVGIPVKELISDPDTGMSVLKIKYPAGFTNVWHRHNCSHGMYVLDRILQSNARPFGPRTFIRFPEGMMMEHGATQDNDVTLLFITNKPFDIRYTFEDQEQK